VEFEAIKRQIALLIESDPSRSQIVTLKGGRGYNLKYLPFAFTESEQHLSHFTESLNYFI